jgi:hypothetical protein
MATDSKARTHVRPIPIAEFCDMIKSEYSNDCKSAKFHINKVALFLINNSSVRTTADLTRPIVEKFDKACETLADSSRRVALQYFGRACNLAIEWGCLKRNPVDGYPIPKASSTPAASEGDTQALDIVRVRNLMGYLKARANTWEGLRFYTLISILLYTDTFHVEAFVLTCPDIADGMIRRKRRKAVSIPPELAEILDAWLPVRRQGKPYWVGNVGYGDKFAEDGRTKIPHEKERAVIALMQQWKGEGWSNQRIADELNRRDIPTKRGGTKWTNVIVNQIIKRLNNQSHKRKKPNESKSVEAEERGRDSEPDWVFPNKSGIGHWTPATWREDSNNPRYLLKCAGKTLGIEGLTFELLRQFNLKNTAPPPPIMSLWSDGQTSRVGTAEDLEREIATISQASPPAPKARPVEAIPWRGTREQLHREIADIESEPCQKSFRTLLAAALKDPPKRLTRADLRIMSKVGDADNHLRKLANTGSRLGKAIDFPGKGGKGIGLLIDIVKHQQ